MQDFDWYEGKDIYHPRKDDYCTYFVYDKGKCIHALKKHEVCEDYERQWKKAGYAVQKFVDEGSYEYAKQNYEDAKMERYCLFVNDLFNEFEVMNNPKNKKAFELAWSYGHASGYSEVFNYFVDLVELIK